MVIHGIRFETTAVMPYNSCGMSGMKIGGKEGLMSKIGFVHKCITIDSTPYGKALLNLPSE